jgi:hypothetical protein
VYVVHADDEAAAALEHLPADVSTAVLEPRAVIEVSAWTVAPVG